MLTADTSVVVASLVRSLPSHERAIEEVDARGRAPLIDHVLLESFSVLTRLPGVRLSADEAAAVLGEAFAAKPLVLPAGRRAGIVRQLAGAGIVGGAAYDGLIALTAAHHGATLLTLDRRAARTYAALGATARQI